MPAERTVENHYVSLLLPSFRKYPDALVFRAYTGSDDRWDTVTYRELELRLAVAQTHWRRELAPLKVQPLDVIGFWLTGQKLSDLINSLAVSALGYTPQFFGGYFNNVHTVLQLLEKSRAKALIVDKRHAPAVAAASPAVPFYEPLEYLELSQLVDDALREGKEDELAFAPVAAVGMDDYAALFHSSGTTGGLPKIIPNTYKMLHSVIKYKWPNAQVSTEHAEQIVVNTLGNLAHIGSFHIFVGSIAMGGCVAQSSSMALKPRELVNMTRECSLNLMVLYATFLSDLIRAAQQDDSVKNALMKMNQILHTGVALNKEDDEWAHAHGIKITTSYGTTESGPMMRANIGSDPSSRLLRPLPGAHAHFIPHNDHNNIESPNSVTLYELVVPSDADDCPPPGFCSEDGYFHTNDLFEKVGDGYIYRGRAGDFIHLLAGFCDTKTIEDNVRKLCADIVHDVVVVGTGRILPSLIVESATGGLSDEQKRLLARTIVERTTEFNKCLFAHERIEDPNMILVVEKGTLPRTKEKGNVRRAATETMFKEQLDLVSRRS